MNQFAPTTHRFASTYRIRARVLAVLAIVYLHGFSFPISLPGSEWRQASSGPWGNIVYRQYRLAIPAGSIETTLQRLEQSTDVSKWTFPRTSRDALANRLGQLGIDLQKWPELHDTNTSVEGDDIVVQPSFELVLGLTVEQRVAIYQDLAGSDKNPNHHLPALFSTDNFDETLRASGLSPANQQLLRQLCYPYDRRVAFSDFMLLFRKLQDESQRRRLVRLFLSHPDLQCRLKLDHHSDLQAIADYWGRWGHREELLAMLESNVQGEDEVDLDISMLLSPFAAQHLHRFPVDFGDQGSELQDCFWSAFNFPNATTAKDPFKGGFANRIREYYRPTTHPSYGDLVLWIDGNGRVVHGAAYVAEDIVFTKNGAGATVPWTLSTLNEVSLKYGKQIRYMSRKLGVSETTQATYNSDNENWITGQSGPWGTIEYRWFTIDIPQEYASPENQDSHANRRAEWVIPGAKTEEGAIRKIAQFMSVHDSKDLRVQRNDRGKWTALPTDAFVKSLPPDVREKFYRFLESAAENLPQRNAYCYYTPHLNRLLATSTLTEHTKRLIREMSYRRGSVTLFADLITLMHLVEDERERNEAATILTGFASVMARVRLTPETDIKTFSEYWTPPNGRSDVASFVNSLRRRTDHTSIDIVHLMSPFIAQRMYRFPEMLLDGASGEKKNCFWTTVSFYRGPMGAKYGDPMQLMAYRDVHFHPIQQPRYGDMVLFNVDGNLLHSGVYIADDLIFTQHGSDGKGPWILCTLADAAARYGALGHVRTEYFRLISP